MKAMENTTFPGMLCHVTENVYLMRVGAKVSEQAILEPKDLVLVLLSDEPCPTYSTVLSRAGVGLLFSRSLEKA